LADIHSVGKSEVDSLIEKISKIKTLRTDEMSDEEARKELAKELRERMKELGIAKVPQARTLLKRMRYTHEDEEPDDGDTRYLEEEIAIYFDGARYHLVHENVLYPPVAKTSLYGETLLRLGFTKQRWKNYCEARGGEPVYLIREIQYITDYMLDKPIEYRLEKDVGVEQFQADVLRIHVNPLEALRHSHEVDKIEEAVRIMARHQLGIDLSEKQIGQVVAFLKTLEGGPVGYDTSR
jgi:hypothetical protein